MFEWRRDPPTADLEVLRRFGGSEVILDLSDAVPGDEPAVSRYVAEARARGLSVRAMAGSPEWVLPELRHLNWQVHDFAHRLGVFDGFVIDHEPWALPQWRSQRPALSAALLETISELADRARMPVTVVLPFWLGEVTAEAMRLLAGHRVAIMAYRNSTAGPDGSAALVAEAFDWADRFGTTVVIAQEVTDVEPAKITFHQLGLVALRAAMAELREGYGRRRGFGGFAINDLATLVTLAGR